MPLETRIPISVVTRSDPRERPLASALLLWQPWFAHPLVAVLDKKACVPDQKVSSL